MLKGNNCLQFRPVTSYRAPSFKLINSPRSILCFIMRINGGWHHHLGSSRKCEGANITQQCYCGWWDSMSLLCWDGKFLTQAKVRSGAEWQSGRLCSPTHALIYTGPFILSIPGDWPLGIFFLISVLLSLASSGVWSKEVSHKVHRGGKRKMLRHFHLSLPLLGDSFLAVAALYGYNFCPAMPLLWL